MKAILHKGAILLERIWDAVRRDRSRWPAVIDPYLGYSKPDSVVARGRVLAKRDRFRRFSRLPAPAKLRNVATMIGRFASDEIAGVTVRIGEWSAVSDEEGYFTFELPVQAVGWSELEAYVEGAEAAAKLPVMVTHPEAEYGVISDIDDTLMWTNAWSLYRNIYTTLTSDALSRRVFPDAVDLLERLHAGKNPVFYVSSSPWNLHAFLVDVFHHNGLVRGPMFLRDLGISKSIFIKGSHGAHKGAAIDAVLAANPTLEFILIGDTGQHDAEVYHEAIRRHPGRIRQVILRAAGPMAGSRDRAWAQAIEDTSVPFYSGADFAGFRA